MNLRNKSNLLLNAKHKEMKTNKNYKSLMNRMKPNPNKQKKKYLHNKVILIKCFLKYKIHPRSIIKSNKKTLIRII